MIRLLELCAKHLSIDVAIGYMLENEEISCDQVRPLLMHFGELKVNPISIPVRWKQNELPSICEMIVGGKL